MTWLLPTRSIETVRAAGNYVEVSTAEGARHLVRETLVRLAEQLGPPFVRVSRTLIIRTDRIIGHASLGRGDTCLTLSDRSRVTLTRRFRRGFMKRSALLGARSSHI
nr:LytTR family DNA-binding domain-containing protein [Qipengyuania qiaonensis]